jgi:hypothetical protein
MHRLEAVAHVGQRAAHDHAHRVVEIRAPHLLFETDRDRFLGEGFHYSALVMRGSGGPLRRLKFGLKFGLEIRAKMSANFIMRRAAKRRFL